MSDKGVVVLPLVALPLESVTGDPKLTPSIANCTVPAGVPEPGATALTVAVKVTWSDPGATATEWTTVVVLAGFTVWLWVFDVLPAKLVLLL